MSNEPHREDPGLLAMKVGGFVVDAASGHPAVILTDAQGKRWLPIVIGSQEASSIALALQEAEPPRPMSHDLMKAIIESTRARVRSVVIHDLRDSTFYSRVHLESHGETFDIDARPSDGIALALRLNAPIFVTDRIPLANAEEEPDALPAPDDEAFHAYIAALKPADFTGGEKTP